MNTVRVGALKTFQHGDRTIDKGSVIELAPLEASILARQGKVSLDRRYMTAAVTVSESPDEPRRRRTYRRRDMVPDEP